MFTKNNILLSFVFLSGSLFHIWALGLNEVLRESDSFAYLQMAHFLKNFSVEGFGSGWFGFVYSLPIALLDSIVGNDFLSGKIVNIILLNISGILLYHISKSFLHFWYRILLLASFFLSPILLHFNIHILSENIYIPLFLLLFLKTWSFTRSLKSEKKQNLVQEIIIIACLLGLLYLTRAEAFIYMLSIGLLSVSLFLQKKLSLKQFFIYAGVFFLSFFVFISPYLFHLHSLTGEWWLTNKGASNYRQAELRGTEKMDDAGFEQAVGELTADKHHLIAGFAGGMKYDTPRIEGSLWQSLKENPFPIFIRVGENTKKFFMRNLPEIFLWKAPSLFSSQDSRFAGNSIFLLFCIFPLIVLLYGIFKISKQHRDFFLLCLSFFLPALLFFTLFFTLNRYFLIFLPLLLLLFFYGVQELGKGKIRNFFVRRRYLKLQYKGENMSFFSQESDVSFWKLSRAKKLLKAFLLLNFFGVLLLSNLVYYNSEKEKDSYYALKKEAWEWMKKNISSIDYKNNSFEERETVWVPIEDWSSFSSDKKELFLAGDNSLDMMERFPIVTYYSGSKTRWITPYTQNLEDIIEYARYNGIEYLVVDTMDFLTYRPALAHLLDNTPENMELVKEWRNESEQKVRIYKMQ